MANFSFRLNKLNFFLDFVFLGALFYKSYEYFIERLPLIVSIFKDFFYWFFILLILILYLRKIYVNDNKQYFSFCKKILVLLFLCYVISFLHIKNRFIIDIFQRDIKNLQYVFVFFIMPILFREEDDLLRFKNHFYFIAIIISLISFNMWLFSYFNGSHFYKGTFGNHYSYGFFELIIAIMSLSDILMFKKIKLLYVFAFISTYLGLLVSTSMSSILCFHLVCFFLLIFTRPAIKVIVRYSLIFFLLNILFFLIGIWGFIFSKVSNSFSGYNEFTKTNEHITHEYNPKNTLYDYTVTDSLFRPYYPQNHLTYKNLPQYTSVAGRLVAFNEFIEWYIHKASFKEIIFGDFKVNGYIEYDNYYLCLIRNNGLVGLFCFILIYILLFYKIFKDRKYLLNSLSDNFKPFFISLSILVLFVFPIMFNFSIFPIIYPINFFIYFLFFLLAWISFRFNYKN